MTKLAALAPVAVLKVVTDEVEAAAAPATAATAGEVHTVVTCDPAAATFNSAYEPAAQPA